MAAEQEGEGFPGEVSPALFARRLEQLGQFAYRFQAPHLPASGPMPPVIDGRPRWSRADLSAFHRYHDFDTAVRIVGNGDVAETLRHVPKVTEVYEALPFTDDDRLWLDDLLEHNFYKQPGDAGAMRGARMGRFSLELAVDHQIITVGDRQGRDARDLVRRWAAWRRGVDEFADRTTYHKAMNALLDIGVNLCPEGYDINYILDPLWWDNERSGELGLGPADPDDPWSW